MGARASRASVPRCWCCGSRFVDRASLLNERQGIFVKKYKPTGEYVCPNQCPPKDVAEQQIAEVQREREEVARMLTSTRQRLQCGEQGG